MEGTYKIVSWKEGHDFKTFDTSCLRSIYLDSNPLFRSLIEIIDEYNMDVREVNDEKK